MLRDARYYKSYRLENNSNSAPGSSHLFAQTSIKDVKEDKVMHIFSIDFDQEEYGDDTWSLSSECVKVLLGDEYIIVNTKTLIDAIKRTSGADNVTVEYNFDYVP